MFLVVTFLVVQSQDRVVLFSVFLFLRFLPPPALPFLCLYCMIITTCSMRIYKRDTLMAVGVVSFASTALLVMCDVCKDRVGTVTLARVEKTEMIKLSSHHDILKI